MKIVRSYAKTILALIAVAVALVASKQVGYRAIELTWSSAKTLLGILPPILVLVHLFDVWVPKEIVVRHMGEGAGPRGFFWALVLGALAAGPLYVAFPVAAMLLKKGVRQAYVVFLLGAWTTVKAPIFLYELNYFGPRFTLIHVGTGLLVALFASLLIEKRIPIKLST
jgi:uncharacterized membrane protein YraQ (UPF0718 family)